MAVFVFDPTAFKIRYPEFLPVLDARLQLFFNEATLHLDNSDASRVKDVIKRGVLLNMLTAHIAYLNGVLNAGGGGASSVPVGRVSSGSEGSVSTSLEFPVAGSALAWYSQSQYGVAYYQAITPYRLYQYIPQQTIIT